MTSNKTDNGLGALLLADAPQTVALFVEKFPNTDWGLDKPVRNIDFFMSLEWFLLNVGQGPIAANDDGIYGAHYRAVHSKVLHSVIGGEEQLGNSEAALAILLPTVVDANYSREKAVERFIAYRRYLPALLETQTFWKNFEGKLHLTQEIATRNPDLLKRVISSPQELPGVINDIAIISAAFTTITKEIMVVVPPPFRPNYSPAILAKPGFIPVPV